MDSEVEPEFTNFEGLGLSTFGSDDHSENPPSDIVRKDSFRNSRWYAITA